MVDGGCFVRDLERIQERKPFKLEGTGLTTILIAMAGVAIIAFFLGSTVQEVTAQKEEAETIAGGGDFDGLKKALGQSPTRVPVEEQAGIVKNGEFTQGADETHDEPSLNEDEEQLGAPTPTIKPALAINVPPKQKVIQNSEEPAPEPKVVVTKKEEKALATPPAPPVEQARYIPKATPAGGPAAAEAPKVTSKQKRTLKKQPLKRGSRTSKSKAKGELTLQIRAFREAQYATSFGETLSNGGYNAYVVKSEIPEKGVWYRVRIGEFGTLKEATDFQEFFEGNEGISTFVSPL